MRGLQEYREQVRIAAGYMKRQFPITTGQRRMVDILGDAFSMPVYAGAYSPLQNDDGTMKFVVGVSPVGSTDFPIG